MKGLTPEEREALNEQFNKVDRVHSVIDIFIWVTIVGLTLWIIL